jgi:hypothetical protein
MQRHLIMTASVATMVLLGCAAADEAPKSGEAAGLKSGPQVGDHIPGVFHPLNVTGAGAGQRVCQI